jgi:hypothetical protein
LIVLFLAAEIEVAALPGFPASRVQAPRGMTYGRD